MLHVTYDVINNAQNHFLKSKMVVMNFAGHFFEILSFFSQFVLENVRNRTKTVLVTLIALNTRISSKIVML